MEAVTLTPAYTTSNAPITNTTTTDHTTDDHLNTVQPVNPLYDKYRYTPIRILRRLTSSARTPRLPSSAETTCQHCGNKHLHTRKQNAHLVTSDPHTGDEPAQPGVECSCPSSDVSHHPSMHDLCTSRHPLAPQRRCQCEPDPLEPFKRDRANTTLKRLSTFVLKSYRTRGHSLTHTSSVRCGQIGPKCAAAGHRVQLTHTSSVRSSRVDPNPRQHRCLHADAMSKSLGDGLDDAELTIPLPDHYLDTSHEIYPPQPPQLSATNGLIDQVDKKTDDTSEKVKNVKS